jgi:ubiquinol-cytochrome c reductase cytochrome b subunit
MTPVFATLFDTLDSRLGLRKPVRETARKVFPSHWSFLLGEVALIAFAILVLTGIFLTMFYRASTQPVVYTGSSTLFAGRELPAAYESIVRLSHDVPGGLLMRRIHRGASHLFIGAIVLHFLRILLTGAFRRPREVNYHLGILLLLGAVLSGYTGHNLPFDVLAGTSLRVAYSFLLSIPWVGEQVALWVFGGEFPTGDLIPRMFAVHVFIMPALLVTGIAAHMVLLVRQKHTQNPEPGVDGNRIVYGEPLWPTQFQTTATLTLFVGGMLVVAALLVPWSDVDLHGPYRVARATNASQPDWFLFWVEGALRLYPALEIDIPGTSISGPFVAGILLPVALIVVMFAYPFLERRFHPSPGMYHVLQHPLDVPGRAGIVAGVGTLLVLLTLAAGHDVIARLTQTPIETVTVTLRVAVLTVPVLVGWAVTRYARSQPVRWPEGGASGT